MDYKSLATLSFARVFFPHYLCTFQVKKDPSSIGEEWYPCMYFILFNNEESLCIIGSHKGLQLLLLGLYISNHHATNC